MELKLEKIEGEYREGFFVQSLMKRAWRAQLEILKEIDRICRKYNITYLMSCGSVLGAVRHHGFIPWDDDLDIEMTRPNYERFRKIALTELQSPFVLGDCMRTDMMFESLIMRVANTDLPYCLEQSFLDKFAGCPYQMGVDVFCMDMLPDDPDAVSEMTNLAVMANGVTYQWDNLSVEERTAILNTLTDVTGYRFNPNLSIKQQCVRLADQISGMYADIKEGTLTRVYMSAELKTFFFPSQMYEDIIMVPFEDMQVPILRDYDYYLRHLYGNGYMTPVKFTSMHDYPCFQGAIDALKNRFAELDIPFPKEFDMEPLDPATLP
ncbi:MAG: LicD family protein [Lachnospiraceae bacterium]|nr:LicD family protein [Lachnospiraceae bacterium]